MEMCQRPSSCVPCAHLSKQPWGTCFCSCIFVLRILQFVRTIIPKLRIIGFSDLLFPDFRSFEFQEFPNSRFLGTMSYDLIVPENADSQFVYFRSPEFKIQLNSNSFVVDYIFVANVLGFTILAFPWMKQSSLSLYIYSYIYIYIYIYILSLVIK